MNIMSIGQSLHLNNWPQILGIWFNPKSSNIRIHMGATSNHNPHYDISTGWKTCNNCVHTFELTYDNQTGRVRIFLDGKNKGKPAGEHVFDRNQLAFDKVDQNEKEVRLMIAHRTWGKGNFGEIGLINFEPLRQ